MDDPFADAPQAESLTAPYSRKALDSGKYDIPGTSIGGQNVNPFANAPQSGGKAATSTGEGSNPFAAAPKSGGMGNYPSLGGVPPSAPGTPPGTQATTGWYDRLPGIAREVVGQAGPAMQAAANAPQVNPATGQVEGQEDQGPAAQLGKYLGKQSPEAASNVLGKGFEFLEGTTQDWLGKGLNAIGVPQGDKLARDITAYLFEAAPMHSDLMPPRGSPMDLVKKVESGDRNIPQNIRDINTLKGTPAQGYYQIIDPTWRKYAPPDILKKYPSAIDAPQSVQDQVAARIPVREWGPNTVQALRFRFPNIDINKPLGEAQREFSGAPAGADVADLPEPREPNSQWYKEQEDRMFQLRQAATADRIQFNQRIENMPDEFKTPEMQERFYKFMENPEGTELSPSEQAYYKATIEPLKREERDLYEELKKTDLDVQDYDPTYAHRIVKGRAPVFDALAGERGSAANPITGYKSLTAPSLKARKFFALVDAQGNRQLITLDNGKLKAIRDRTATTVQPTVKVGEDPAKGIGDKVTINGKEWTVANARTDEIEANTDQQYYKNAAANTIDNLLRLRAAARATFYFNDLKNSPEFAMIARKYDAKNIPSNWVSPHMPLLSGYKMEPYLTHAIDDFYGTPKGDLAQVMQRINNLAVRSLFWSPFAHAGNAGAFWATARSWDWVTPPGLKSVFVDSAKALREVATMGPEYQRLLRDGASFVYGSVKNQDFYAAMLRRLGDDVKRNPSYWDPIARIMGVGPSDLIKWWYNKSSNALWLSSDVFLMQRILELERKGLSSHAAITEAEKTIPNYRIPAHVLGSRAAAEILKNPALTEFSRYHYGAMRAMAHMANDLVGKDKSPAKRFDALGRIFVTGTLLFYVWPAISYGIQKLTGDQNLEYGPKGSTRIPKDLIDLYNGDKSFVQVLSDMVTIAPLLKTGLEMYSGTDWFTGDKILGPVDRQKSFLHQVGKEADYAAQNLVQPYGMLEQAGRPKTSLAKEALKTGLGLRNKPKKYIPSKDDWRKDARRRKGLIERGFDKL